MNHRLLIDIETFHEIRDGGRKFDIRELDRNYQIGDSIQYSSLYPDGTIEDDHHYFVVTYILKNVPQLGLRKDCCILSIERDAR